MKKASEYSLFVIDKIRETEEPILKPGDPQFEANKVRAAELSDVLTKIHSGEATLEDLKRLAEKYNSKP